MTLEELVDECYETRMTSWESARALITNWLRRQCNEALPTGDRSRLDVNEGRIKDHDRTLRKLSKRANTEKDDRDRTFLSIEEEVRDLVGVKILCKSTRDQELIVKHLSSKQDESGILRDEEVRDYVKNPKDSGYRAVHLHYSVQVAGDCDPVTVEVQIKTRLQDAWGELTHEDLYKPGGAFRPDPHHESVARKIADLLAIADFLSDDLADRIEQAISISNNEVDESASSDTKVVTVCYSVPKYALADDIEGHRGLIPAHVVRELAGSKELIDVDDYLKKGDSVRAKVMENDTGTFYIPVELPE